uniref:Secreted protein n=1 Tax=Rhipicephalus appendiculatus TaxID=34631 RepID=A0A131YBM8_RHIAP
MAEQMFQFLQLNQSLPHFLLLLYLLPPSPSALEFSMSAGFASNAADRRWLRYRGSAAVYGTIGGGSLTASNPGARARFTSHKVSAQAFRTVRISAKAGWAQAANGVRWGTTECESAV